MPSKTIHRPEVILTLNLELPSHDDAADMIESPGDIVIGVEPLAEDGRDEADENCEEGDG